ncbi:hypothetical protein CTI12_AA315090 [Artemisia annua]|uniref:DUF1639 family protein n=1 Tax=Artemisia annua TaxID=35608 RepID=A0A2U1N2K0_ARTAN|nr:hypothetical protein CTI12_AA315090 [Artemisia annua]
MASPVPAKSQPLHNFSLPHLKWKNHRKQSPIRHHHHHSDHESADFMTNQRKRSSSSSRICIKVTSSHVVSTSALEDESSLLQKTWNLRPRRPVMNHNNNSNGGVMKIGSSSMTENKSVNGNSSNNFSTNKEVLMDSVKGNEKQKFSIGLTRDEIEEDIFMLTGMKPARRPKKRPRNVQKQLDTLFPGLWLGSITADSYKVSENPPKV